MVSGKSLYCLLPLKRGFVIRPSIHLSIHLLIHPLIPDQVVWAAAQVQSSQPSLSSVMLVYPPTGGSPGDTISLPGPGPSLRSPSSQTSQEHLPRMTPW